MPLKKILLKEIKKKDVENKLVSAVGSRQFVTECKERDYDDTRASAAMDLIQSVHPHETGRLCVSSSSMVAPRSQEDESC